MKTLYTAKPMIHLFYITSPVIYDFRLEGQRLAEKVVQLVTSSPWKFVEVGAFKFTRMHFIPTSGSLTPGTHSLLGVMNNYLL